MNDIFCFGDCNVDIITPIDEIPVKGGCSFSSEVSIGAGGSTLNTTAALNNLKLPVALISKIGNDSFGNLLIDFLNSMQINTQYIIKSAFPTGLVLGLVAPDGEKRWIAIRGNAADIHMTKEDIDKLKLPEVLYITGVELVEGKESRETAIEFARMVSKNGGRVFLDPNIRVPTWELDNEVRNAFDRIMPYVEVLLSNEKETQMLGESENLKLSAQSILKKGVDTIWLKLGGKGSAYYTKDCYMEFEPSKVKVVDTSGAGDAFNAAVIYGNITGLSPEQTGAFANMYAGYTVMNFGTTQALPLWPVVEKMIEKVR